MNSTVQKHYYHQSRGEICTSLLVRWQPAPVPLIAAKKALLVNPLFEEEHVDLQFTSSVPLAFVSNSEHSVLQKLNNHIINVLTEFFVSFSRQMKVIKHVLVAYDAITPYKAWIRVQVN